MFQFLRSTTMAIVCGFVCGFTSVAVAQIGLGPFDDAAPLELEQPPEPFRPKRPRAEHDLDRLHAAALYATGCTKQQRGNLPGALRDFQRAWRYDPAAQSVLLEVIALADQLRRDGVSRRYSMKLDVSQLSDIRQLHRLGLLLYVGGQYAQSATAFATVLRAIEAPDRFGLSRADAASILQNASRTYRLVGESFLEAGRLDEAKAVFIKANQAQANRSLQNLDMARIDARSKNPAAALAKLDDYFARPSIPSAGMMPYELLSEVLTALGRKNELLERLERQARANPGDVALGYYLAPAYRQAGRLKLAEAQYRKLIEKQPLVDAFTGLAEIYFRQQKAAQLLQVLSDYLARSSATDLQAFGDLAKSLAGDAPLLKGMAKAASDGAAGDGAAGKTTSQQALVLAMIYAEGEQWDDARRYFTLALNAEGARKAEILRTWALDLMMAERFDESAELLRRSLKQQRAEGEKALTHYLLAGVLEYAGKTDTALVAAREAVRLRPASPHFASRVAWVLYHAERTAQAKSLYRQFIKRYDPSYGSESLREIVKEARTVMSNLCVTTEDFDESERWLEEVLDEFPDDIGTLNDLGYLWADRGKHLRRSLAMVRRAVEAEPDNTAYRDSLGWALFRLGRFEEAAVELEKAIRGEPDGMILDHLADAYRGANRPAQAVATWRRAAKRFGQQGDQEKRKGVERKIQRLQENSDKRSVKESK